MKRKNFMDCFKVLYSVVYFNELIVNFAWLWRSRPTCLSRSAVFALILRSFFVRQKTYAFQYYAQTTTAPPPKLELRGLRISAKTTRMSSMEQVLVNRSTKFVHMLGLCHRRRYYINAFLVGINFNVNTSKFVTNQIA